VVGERGKIWRTTDGGASWKGLDAKTDKWLSAVSFASAQVGIALASRCGGRHVHRHIG
jgi:photosystem II stability/assembly factor-like uncharacterized protein